METLRTLFGKWLPARADRTLLILGLDACGKTTILYRLVLDPTEIITTIPTIGFNVEKTSIKTRAGTVSVSLWDVGGCDKIRPLWRHYFSGLSGLMYIVDSNDRERFPEAVEEFRAMLTEIAALSDVGDQRIPVIVIANKQDLPNAMGTLEIREKFAPTVGNRAFAVYPSRALEPHLSQTGLPEAFEWLTEQIVTPQAPSVSQPPNPSSTTSLSTKLEEWLLRQDDPDDVFLSQLDACTLDTWDHYTHLRIAYLYLTREGRQKGKNLIFDKIEHFIKHSPRTNGKTFHLTLTYFWIQLVNYGIRSMKPPPEEFKQFLVMNPHLADGNLPLEYYSKETLFMDPKARTEMVLPDKKPLPSVIPRETAKRRR
ncbi:small GTP-binding protein domain [Spizellomyces punctatus DAOM BR117]|uniref:ADP-ribosylation factor n=1 Tax=Spizellomyces punctatus (strain DAOM BR117) TaxID=645134 RepID=A0A0L0HAH8_SPIPD|nr:small GTP-binding protein domain [Spizellomyces punctatus DAOM BR117]KNC97698.1 small GTP-binding protein domain [Spizellomyces punctatus DAOM BR117]|eukprot:XP_016605738.1 small GTP-binding protein domain [Spizellomyces punctatus DAOM BR117]